MADSDDAKLKAEYLQWLGRSEAEKEAQLRAQYAHLLAERKAEEAARQARTAKESSDSLEDLARQMRESIADINEMRRRLV